MPRNHTGSDWTAELLHALPDDGNRYEVIDGALLVSPAASLLHQRAVIELCFLLRPYGDRVGQDISIAPTPVTFSKRREVQPDLFAMPLVNGRRVERFEDVGRVTLAVEVLSPFTTRDDRQTKRNLYQSEGVPEYWIIDSTSRLVERWCPGDDEPEVLLTSLSWQPSAQHDPLVIDLQAYFRLVHGM